MGKIELERPFKGYHGKLSLDSDTAIVTNKMSGVKHSRKITKRDLKKHPITAREKEMTNKMRDLVAEYKEIKAYPEAYAQLVAERNSLPKNKQGSNIYSYFIRTRMSEGMNSVSLKIAKKGSNVDSYVEGMKRCQTIEEADRLLVKFVEVLGYKKLAEAYRRVGK